MAFNRFMHPRNRYKDNRPSFEELARKYPEFGKHVVRNQSGSATLDFHNAESLKALTCTLLKEDFGLNVELPLDRLIPTLSLRLNYIHWIEDLFASSGHNSGPVVGIDIGCGASCIYPLLGAQMNGWEFLASEVDALAIHYARENVARNELTNKITVVETSEDAMFKGLLERAPSRRDHYSFTMCNPPFFGNLLEAQGIMASRSAARPEPKTVSTAAEQEMIADGGEVEFVRRMITESLHLREHVMWYTSMLGKKSSLVVLREELHRCKIRNVTFTEFCQGRTMRWGIAWTFHEDIEPPLPASKKRKLMERRHPFIIPVPDSYIKRVQEAGTGGGLQSKIQSVATALQLMMQNLQMEVDRKQTSKWCAKFELKAQHNTWSHQRRKRRKEKQRQAEPVLSSAAPESSTSQTQNQEDNYQWQGETSSSSSLSQSRASITIATHLSASHKDLRSPLDDSNTTSPVAQTGGEESSALADIASSSTGHPRDGETSLDHRPSQTSVQLLAEPCETHIASLSKTDEAPSGYQRSDGSSDDADDNFPLVLQLEVKLGEKRAIVMETNVEDNSKRHLLHQVVQYIKNQMK
ncbi:RNA N(6)-adenosine-methyltransferase mettl16-like [Diadema antillarum]|uniref:RNA N(6)-adenosine-methyltransferase mettl16-like n=1 Tax=Diadema antillarum TaxID=105358 RepID=UPI003A892EB6